MKMPASTSTVELAGAALKSSLSKNNNNDNNYLDGHILASTKKSLLNDFEFESSENHQLTVLDALKTKYILLKAPEISQNGQKKTEQKERTAASPNNKSDEEIQCVQKIQTELFPMEKIQLGWSHRKDWSVGAGMVNMGNTCYLNSTLQALFHVPSLVNWLISDKEHTAHCENSGVCIICAMRKTLEESQQRNITSIRPILIFNKLRSVYRNLIPGRQEDAHEFLRYLVEAMEKAYLQRFKNSTQFESKVKETTPLNQILGGYLRSAVRCLKCGHISTTFQHFQDLPLDIRKAQTIDEALELYFSRENLDDESYLCESCHRKVPATKQFQMERAPMVLCIQLKRFSVSNNKISKNIIFRQRLDLSRYASRKPKIALNYRLVALITHMGLTVNCGHYTAVAQSPAGGYYQFDDSMVRQVSHQSVFNTNAYIMFYELENSAHIPKFLPSLNLNKAAAKPSSTITEPAADAAASSTTTTTKILLPVSSSSSSSSTKKINNKIPTTSTTEIVLPVNSAKSLPPLGVGFTSDKVYGPELPPERLNVTSSSSSSFTMNGKSKATTTSLKLTDDDDDDESSTECSAEEEEEDESIVKVKNSPSVTDATTTKEADSSTTSNEETLLLLASSSDNSPNNNNCSVVSTSNNTNNNNNSSRDNNKNNSSNKKKISVSSSPSKSLVPYETGDTSGSEDSNHSDNNKVATKVTMGGDWQVTSSTDVTTSSSSDKNNNKKNQRGVSNNISGGNSSNNNKVINELFKLSTAGYSAPVSTWNGTRSQLDKEINQEKREDRKRSLADSSSEDAPRAKRAKINSSLFKTKSNPGYNPVQEFHNMKNSWNNNNNNNGSSSSSSSGSGNNNQNYHHKPFYKHRRNNFNNHRGTNSRGNFHRNISRFR